MIEHQLEGARQPVTEEPAWFLPGVQMLLLGIVVILVGIAVGVSASHLTGAASDGLVALTVLLVLCGGLMLAGLTPVSPGHARVIQLFGRYCGTIRDAGLKWVNPFTKRLVVSTRIRQPSSRSTTPTVTRSRSPPWSSGRSGTPRTRFTRSTR